MARRKSVSVPYDTLRQIRILAAQSDSSESDVVAAAIQLVYDLTPDNRNSVVDLAGRVDEIRDLVTKTAEEADGEKQER